MGATRLFHFVEGGSSKFWQITVEGNSFTAVWGRIGTAGQTQTKDFATDAAAQAAADKLVAEKVKKGYLEQGEGVAPVAAEEASSRNRVAPAATPVANVKRAATPAAEEQPAQATAVPEPEPEPAPTLPANLEVKRRIDLGAEVLAQVPWAEVVTLQRPEAPAFDRKEALGRLAKVKGNYWWDWDWSKTPLSPGMSQEEAQFWFGAMTHPGQLKPKQVAEKLEAKPVKPVANLEEALKAVAKSRNDGMAVLPMTVLFGARPLVEALIKADKDARTNTNQRVHRQHELDVSAITEGLALYAVPYLSPEDREALKNTVRPEILPSNWPAASGYFSYDVPPFAFILAAALGMSKELLPVVESWPDDMYSSGEEWADHYQKPQSMIFALSSPELMEHHFRRLKLKLKTPEQMAAWLARMGFRALDIARDSITALTNKEEADKMFAAFAVAQAPEVAPLMIELMLNSKAPKQAREWLDAHPQHAVLGLIPVAAGRGRVAEAAGEYLAGLSKKGGKDLIEAALARFPEETATRVRAALAESSPAGEEFDAATTPDWLKEALATTGKGTAPKWVSPQDLPPVMFGQHRLADAQVSELLRALAGSTLQEAKPLVTAIKKHADRGPLERFAWKLFDRWLSEGGPSKEKWAMMAVGLLGGDECALKLTPMVRVWPGESQHQRAVLGLEVLRAIGTDTALMQINGIAQKLQFKGLKTKAAECMEGIATDRGMTRAELEDRIVPDCGLDERGTRTFDFGSRQFRLVLGAGLKPMVKDADGAVKPDLPKPNAKDDAALAADAVAQWKLLKKQVADVAKVQGVRLEQAMVTGRRWTREEFELLLVKHPLMTNIVRLVVWAAHDASGERAATFRVTEDQTYADSSDDTFDLTPYPHVSVIHPLHMSDGDRAAWGELLSDYEIVPPFTQLGRALFALEGKEAEATDITRFKDVAINPQSLVFTLEKLGWQRGIPEDGGVFYSHSKPFYGAGVTAVVVYEEGVPVGYMEGWDDQKMTHCYVIPELWKPDWYWEHKNKLTLGEVDAVVISEVLNDLTTIAAKGK